MFDRFAIVHAYYLFYSMFGFAYRNGGRDYTVTAGYRPGLTINRAVTDGTVRSRPYLTYGLLIPKNDDYQATRDAYARLIRKTRSIMAADRLSLVHVTR